MRSVSRLATSVLLPALGAFAACSSTTTGSAPDARPDASSMESGTRPDDAAGGAVDGDTEGAAGSSGSSGGGGGSGSGAADGSMAEGGAKAGAWPPPLPAGAVSYYVSPTGKDSGAGTLADPWLTTS